MTLLFSVFVFLLLGGFAMSYLKKANQDRTYLNKMYELAVERGGNCLSDKYVNSATKLRWKCAEGHVWEAAPSSINRGRWCPECLGTKRLTIEGMQEIGAERGGKCLSDTYVNSTTELRWECRERHVWEATPDSIAQGSWCPECSTSKRLTIDGMHELAAEKGGRCLSDKYVDFATKLKWECRERHAWEATPDSITQGSWCPECSRSKLLTIDGMRELAAERGGNCLSDKYVNSATKLRWECNEGHVWEEKPHSIRRGSWCPECSGAKRLTIDEMQNIAAVKGGRCLSDKYVSPSTKIRWECGEGHVWEATPDSIKRGSWCPECQ